MISQGMKKIHRDFLLLDPKQGLCFDFQNLKTPMKETIFLLRPDIASFVYSYLFIKNLKKKLPVENIYFATTDTKQDLQSKILAKKFSLIVQKKLNIQLSYLGSFPTESIQNTEQKNSAAKFQSTLHPQYKREKS